MELRHKINAKILLLAMLGAIMVCSSYLIYIYEPLQMILRKFLTLSPSSIIYYIWMKPPYDVYIKVFIFNISNPQEFLDGKDKLRVNQVGPYVYRESLINTNSHFNENGSLTFQPVRYLEFVRERSVGDVKEDRILSVNIPLLGITSALQNSSMFVNLAVASISSYLDSKPFVNLTIHEYLWGYDDPLVELANQVVPNWIDFPRFGILDRLMALDNASNVVTISAAPDGEIPYNPLLTQEELARPYIIQRWNGSPGLTTWGYRDTEGNETLDGNSRCNLLEGASDGSIYPRHLNTTIRLFRRAFCRPVTMTFVEKCTAKHGFAGHRFHLAKDFLATAEEYPENSCYCVKGNCPPKGIGFLTPCYYDIPVSISQPHFLNADPILMEKIGGLNPNEEEHGVNVILHPGMGVPLEARISIQINLNVEKTKFNSRTKPFHHHTLPLFWLQMVVEDVPTSVYLYIMLFYHVLPVVMQVLVCLLVIVGLTLILGCSLAVLFYPKNQDEMLFGLRTQIISMLGLRSDYTPIPIIPIAHHYFKPDVRISSSKTTTTTKS